MNISSSVVKGAWMTFPRLLPLKPLILKSRVCFMRSLMSSTVSELVLLSEYDLCLRPAGLGSAGPEPTGATDNTGEGGRDGRGVR